MLFTMELSESLKEFVEEGQDWERKNTSVKGVSIVRMPPYKNRPASLAIEINPVKEDGSPMKKKGGLHHEHYRTQSVPDRVQQRED